MPSASFDRVLADDYLDDLSTLAMDEVRRRRSECQDVEVSLSYARRLVQGRLDIIHDEIERRTTGQGARVASEVVDRLKGGEILGSHERPVGFGRLPTLMAPSAEADDFIAEIDAVAHADELAKLTELSDEVLGELADQLTQLERSLSDRRRQVFDRIDQIQSEIVSRYKSGRANPDELLNQ